MSNSVQNITWSLMVNNPLPNEKGLLTSIQGSGCCYEFDQIIQYFNRREDEATKLLIISLFIRLTILRLFNNHW